MKFSYRKSELAFRRRYLVRALRAAEMNRSHAAKIAGLNRTHFLGELQRFKISASKIPMRAVYSVRPFKIERREFARRFFERALKRAGGSPAALAALVGIDRTHVYRLLPRLGVGLRPQGGGRRGNRGNAAWQALQDRPESRRGPGTP